MRGKIIDGEKNIIGVIIVNQSTKESTTTDEKGEFTIKATSKDVLTIASPTIEGIEIVLNDNSFRQNPLKIQVVLKARLLEEVVVRNINAKSLGIIQKNVKEYTPAERKLYTATGGGNLYGLNTSVSLDGILNQISGRTAMLKKELKVEGYETNNKKLSDLFPDQFYIETLKLSKENVDGFVVFASENDVIIDALKEKNVSRLKFKLIELAIVYKEQMKLK
ncbi:MAG: hypothetical protein QM535_00350 [Limnohabitans sp.]|nr:hypothetical protein [Limnohabitans sp.]